MSEPPRRGGFFFFRAGAARTERTARGALAPGLLGGSPQGRQQWAAIPSRPTPKAAPNRAREMALARAVKTIRPRRSGGRKARSQGAVALGRRRSAVGRKRFRRTQPATLRGGQGESADDPGSPLVAAHGGPPANGNTRPHASGTPAHVRAVPLALRTEKAHTLPLRCAPTIVYFMLPQTPSREKALIRRKESFGGAGKRKFRIFPNFFAGSGTRKISGAGPTPKTPRHTIFCFVLLPQLPMRELLCQPRRRHVPCHSEKSRLVRSISTD